MTDVLNKPRDWNEYQEMLAQLDLTLAFLDAGVLVEIEPTIPSTMRKTDALLLVGGASVYCEMTSPRLSVSPQSAGESQDVKRVIRHLQPKVTRQLPAPSHGLLAMDTTKCGLFSHDVRVIAAAVIPHHRNLLGICLWSWEGDDDDFSFKTPTVLLSHSSTLHLGLARQVANLLKAPLELADF